MAPKIAWEPTEKQTEFLAASEDEVLFGGGAGGGKSAGLVVDALGLHQRAVANPRYRALLIRRTFSELRDLIDRAQALYPCVSAGAKYHEQSKEFRFPSGAAVEFGYLAADSDRFQYQGREFQYVGFDELTLYSSPVAWEFMRSRLRTSDENLTCFMRATCNPGGVGGAWVQDYWRIPDDGSASKFSLQVGDKTIWRRFIPARLSDNPFLANSGYRERLMSLSAMDRRALLEGRWDVTEIPGQVYKTEIEAAYSDGRICRVPHMPGVPVNTFWDLGRNNATGVWCHQKVGIEHHFINYYEDRLTGLDTYIKWLQSQGYIFGTHYLPHDGDVEELIANKSRKAVLEDARIGDVQCVERINELNDGIDMVRRVFPLCYFDKDACDTGLNGLKSYRYEWNEMQQVWRPKPLHDWASTAADSFRQFAQGYINPVPAGLRRNSRRANNWRTA